MNAIDVNGLIPARSGTGVSGPRPADSSDRYADAQRAAEQLVASVFVQPILAAVRESAGSGTFGAGTGEQRMGPLLDQRIADEIVRAAGWSLVDRVRDQVHANRIEVQA